MNKKFNLYIDALTYKKGKAFGYNEYLFNLLNYFYDNRNDLQFSEVYIVCEENQKKDFYKFSDKIKVIGFHYSNIIQRVYVQGVWNYKIPIKKNDVILSTANYSNLFKRCKQVLVIHDLLYLHGDWLKSKLIKYQRKLLVPRSIKLADKIIAISKFTKNDIISFFPAYKNKIQVVYNYFNFYKFGKIDYSYNNKNGFISVASRAFHKNTITLLKAFMKYKIKGGNQTLTLIGTFNPDSEEQELFNQISNNYPNSIYCKSHISNNELALEYSKAATYISASFFEGLGMPIVEAMHFNLKLILPSTPSVFTEISNGHAIFFDSKNADELADILIKSDTNKISGIIQNYELNRFDEINTSGLYISILNNI